MVGLNTIFQNPPGDSGDLADAADDGGVDGDEDDDDALGCDVIKDWDGRWSEMRLFIKKMEDTADTSEKKKNSQQNWSSGFSEKD